MSRTSSDGLDIAYCKFWQEQSQWKFDLVATESGGYSSEWKTRLENAYQLSPADYSELDNAYGRLNAERINAFMNKHSLETLDAIVSHGHTVYHIPKEKSIQAGSAREIAELCKTTVINNLRAEDVKANGQGAPIVPIGDLHLFSDYRFCLNLGGIANISAKQENQIVAWDTSGCNLMLNLLANEKNQVFDEDGKIAAEGKVNEAFLKRLNEWEYLQRTPPKSLEAKKVLAWFSKENDTDLSVEDRMRTVVEFIALNVARVLVEQHATKQDKVLISGGGAFNATLVQALRNNCLAEVVVPDKQIVEYKEAMVMAFYGVLRLLGLPNCIPAVTGANKAVSGGDIFKIA